MDIIGKIAAFKIVHVIILEDAQDALPLGKAVLEAGLPIAEVTFRSKAAAESISILRKEFPDMIIGAGTVLSIDQVRAAVDAGSQFIVTPGFNNVWDPVPKTVAPGTPVSASYQGLYNYSVWNEFAWGGISSAIDDNDDIHLAYIYRDRTNHIMPPSPPSTFPAPTGDLTGFPDDIYDVWYLIYSKYSTCYCSCCSCCCNIIYTSFIIW